MFASPEALHARVRTRNPGEPEFHQAVGEVFDSIWPFLEKNPHYHQQGLLERLVEPERIIQFRVAWVDDRGEVQVNRGWRVQMNSAIGPCKGGIRFHPDLNAGILKFLAFEQTFKNSLTSLPLGSGKGGADFNTHGRSDGEVMRFCQTFMTELYRHIGPDTDVPAGDIGVGAREIGFLYGMYRKLRNENTGAFTGKGLSFGGSLMRPEATGYGLVYFVEEMLRPRGRRLRGLRVAISGAGNVAQHAAKKAMEYGATVISLSDTGGTVHMPDGLTDEQFVLLQEIKNNRRGQLAEFAAETGLIFLPAATPWHLPCDVALPCATQNELHEADAHKLLAAGCGCVAEGANMPCTPEAIRAFRNAGILYAPGKAANAGGVAVSGLEMSQNALRLSWTAGEVDTRLQAIMLGIHQACVRYGTRGEQVDYVVGANTAGFVKVADAMLAQGIL